MEDLRYNNIVIATDADVDGMHIRSVVDYFLFAVFPRIDQRGASVYILQTPLFRVRATKSKLFTAIQ